MANKSQFFPPEVHDHFKKTETGSLEAIVSGFPIQLKKVMYAVAEKGKVTGKRWVGSDGTGCAFNEAGKIAGSQVTSTFAAAKAFGVSESLVSRFISTWDSMNLTDKGRATLLKRVLTDVGVETPPGYANNNGRSTVINSYAFKGAQTQFLEQLETVETVADMGFSDEEIQAASDLVDSLVGTS